MTASYTDLQDYTYYFVPAPWLSVKLLRLLQHYPPPEDPGVRGRLNECLDTILNKAQEPPKSKKVQEDSLYNFLSLPKNKFFQHKTLPYATQTSAGGSFEGMV